MLLKYIRCGDWVQFIKKKYDLCQHSVEKCKLIRYVASKLNAKTVQFAVCCVDIRAVVLCFCLHHLWHKDVLSLCGYMQQTKRIEIDPLSITYLSLPVHPILLLSCVQPADRNLWTIGMKFCALARRNAIKNCLW